MAGVNVLNPREWLLDATLYIEGEPVCFVPYDREKDAIIFGLNYLAGRCPGKLVGVIHGDGQEAVEAWVAEHPDWIEQFGPTDD